MPTHFNTVLSGSNESRRRWYGLRPGDTVTFMSHEATVVELNTWDNNGCFLRDTDTPDQKPYNAVCEWCKITRKVEEQ